MWIPLPHNLSPLFEELESHRYGASPQSVIYRVQSVCSEGRLEINELVADDSVGCVRRIVSELLVPNWRDRDCVGSF